MKKLAREFYKGVKMNQAVGTMGVFKSFLSNEKFDTLVELGTGRGTLTLFLSNIFNGKIHTFSIGNVRMVNELQKNGVEVVKADVFDKGIIKYIKELIDSPGRVLLLCDNGDKVKEFTTFAPCLKKNDVIMAHDYFKDTKSQDKSIWTGCEITEVDVKNSVASYNLHPFFQEEFSKIAWMCKIRG